MIFKFIKFNLSDKKKEKEEDSVEELKRALNIRIQHWKTAFEQMKATNEVLENKLEQKNAKLMRLYAKSAEQETALKAIQKRIRFFEGHDGLELPELSAALGKSQDCDKFLKAIFFLIRQRSQLYTVDLTQGQNDDTNKIIFKNGAFQALKGLDEDIKALVSQTWTESGGDPQLDATPNQRGNDRAKSGI